MARIERSTFLEASPDTVWHHVNRPATLLHISAPILIFRPVDPPALPDRFADGRYLMAMRFLGVLPVGQQEVNVSRPAPDGPRRFVRDNGRSRLIRRWDHLITIAPEGNGTRYTDRVEVEAGLLTPFVALFARIFYAHRQRRWRALIRADFRPLTA